MDDYSQHNHNENPLTPDQTGIYSIQLERRSYIYVHHFDVSTLVARPVLHK